VDLYYSTASTGSKWFTRALHDLTLDKETQTAWLDWSPEWTDMVLEFGTGGTGRFLNQSFDLMSRFASGRPIERNEVPLLRKITGDVTDGDRQRYGYEKLYEIIDLGLRLNRIQKYEREDYQDARAAAGDRVKLINLAKVTKKGLANLRKLRDKARETDDYEKEVYYQEKINDRLNRFTKRYREVVYNQPK